MGIYRVDGISGVLAGKPYTPPATSNPAGFAQALPPAQTAAVPVASGSQPSLAQLLQNYNDAVAAARANGTLPNGPYAPGFLGSPNGPKVPQAVTDAWNKLHAGQGQTTLAPPTVAPPPLTGLTGPLDPAFTTLWTNAAGDTDPANTEQNQVIEALSAAQLWSDEATRRQGLAAQAQQDADAAKAKYGENSPQYLTALAQQKEAEGAYTQAIANAMQAGAQLNVYATDPSYAPAMNGAAAVINAGVKLPQPWVPTGHGSLADARAQLAKANQTVQEANQAVQDYQDAAAKFSQLPNNYNPSALPPIIPQTLNDPHQLTYVQKQDLYYGGLQDMADGNTLTADVWVGVLTQQLASLKQGTKEYDDTLSALNQAEDDKAKAAGFQAEVQPYSNLAASNEHLYQVNQQYNRLKNQALAATRQAHPNLFDPGGYVTQNGNSSGQLTGTVVTIGKDGQLHATLTYQHWTNDIQLTFAPGRQPAHSTDAQQKASADWASFNAPAQSASANLCLPTRDTVALAIYQQASAQRAVNLLPQQKVNQLTTAYKDAAAKAGIFNTTDSSGQPIPPSTLFGKDIPPAVTAAWSDLQPALKAYAPIQATVQANDQWLSFLMTQDLSNYGNRDRQNELSVEFFNASQAERQRKMDAAAQLYNQPILLQAPAGGQQSQQPVWDTQDKLYSGVSGALNGQPADITAVTDKIQQLAGKGGKVQVVPTFFAPDSGGLIQSALFLVTDAGNHQYWVDSNARDYNKLADYQHNSKLPVAGILYVPTLAGPAYQLAAKVTGQKSPSAFVYYNGNPVIQSLKIDGPSKVWQAVDGTVGIVTSVATVLTVSPLAPVAGLAAIAGGAYLAVRAGQDLYDMSEHGQDWGSKEGLTDMGMILASLLPDGAGAMRSIGLYRNGMKLVPALRSGFHLIDAANPAKGIFGAPWAGDAQTVMNAGGALFGTAEILNAVGMAGGLGLMGASGYDTVTQWDNMSDSGKLNSGLSFASGLFASGMGYISRKGVASTPAGRGDPASLNFESAGTASSLQSSTFQINNPLRGDVVDMPLEFTYDGVDYVITNFYRSDKPRVLDISRDPGFIFAYLTGNVKDGELMPIEESVNTYIDEALSDNYDMSALREKVKEQNTETFILIGSVEILPTDEEGKFEIGYWVDLDHRNGVIFPAVIIKLKHFLQSHENSSLYATVDPRNKASSIMLARLGLRKIGEVPQHELHYADETGAIAPRDMYLGNYENVREQIDFYYGIIRGLEKYNILGSKKGGGPDAQVRPTVDDVGQRIAAARRRMSDPLASAGDESGSPS
jgi:RimJ/RimL family protein N-acetyltransferase